MGNRGKVIVASVVFAALAAAWWGLGELGEQRHARAVEQAAQDVAQRHVDLVATATPDDLRDLWETSLSEDPGSLRTAGELLASEAAERIKVVSVGTAYESDEPLDTGLTTDFDAHRAVDVHYRLGGEEYEGTLHVVRLEGEDGTDPHDWKVVNPMVSAVTWATGPTGRIRVGTVDLERHPLAAYDGAGQVFYPATYHVREDVLPWFEGVPTTFTAAASAEPMAAPDLVLRPTRRTQALVRGAIWNRFDQCGDRRDSYRCPLNTRVDLYTNADEDSLWWRGFQRRPRIRFDSASDVTLVGGIVNVATPQGVRRLRFKATATYSLSLETATPYVWDLEVEV